MPNIRILLMESKIICHLVVYSGDQRRANSHSDDHASMKILVKDDGLNERDNKEEHGIDIAMPSRFISGVNKPNHQPDVTHTAFHRYNIG